MPVVSIVELCREEADPSAADGTRRNSNRVFSVTNHSANHGPRQQRFEVPSTPLELMDELRWYLEDFAVMYPLETKRVDRAKHSLKDVGRALVNSIEWASIVGPEGRNEPLLLSVQEQPCGFAPVMWELLEDSELWDNRSRTACSSAVTSRSLEERQPELPPAPTGSRPKQRLHP